MTLTDRQSAILSYIRESISLRGYPPTIREIGAKFGIKSPNGVHCHIRALRMKGFLADGGKRRIIALPPGSIMVVEQAPKTKGV